MKKIEIGETESLVINNVVITPRALSRLREFQFDDNHNLEDDSRILADAICQIAMLSDISGEDTGNLITELSHIRMNMNDFKRPLLNIENPEDYTENAECEICKIKDETIKILEGSNNDLRESNALYRQRLGLPPLENKNLQVCK